MTLMEHPANALSQRVIGAAIEVHSCLGPGLLESTYHACLRRELELRGIDYQREVTLPLEYKGVEVGSGYRVDLLIEKRLIVEAKAVASLLPVHTAQLLTYMRLMNITAGLLLNFNVTRLTQGIRRRLL